MQKTDIREIKTSLRVHSKEYRASLSENKKRALDEGVFDNLKKVNDFLFAEVFLCYMSTDTEVDTKKIIDCLFKNGKTVFVPKCIDGTRNIKFYEISSFSQTEKGTFGVYEPIADKCKLLHDFRNSVCIVPGLCFDTSGFRLGYGKGYYDRFLNSYTGLKIGICYDKCVCKQLPHDFFDVPIDLIVTEKKIIHIKKEAGKNNGR